MTFLRMLCKAMTLALLVTQAGAGFLLNYPESAGYNAVTEPNAPCGGAAANVLKSNMTFWAVSGGPIYLTSQYTITNYLFRATLDANLTDGWVNLLPVLQQNGIGDFCEPVVPVPASFDGQTGILQVIAQTTDGMFYQCAVLMFQTSAAAAPQGSCKNGSSVFGEYIADDAGLNMIASSSVEAGGAAMSSMSSMSMSMSMASTTSSMSMMSTTMPASSTMTSMPSSSATLMPNKSSHSLKGGAIAGIVVGVVSGISIALLLALFCIRKRRNASIHEKQSSVDSPRKYAAELSGDHGSPVSPALDNPAAAYPATWTAASYPHPQVPKPADNGTVDSGSTTAASARMSGYSDLSAAAGPAASPTSPASREHLRAEYERVRKQRQRLEEVNALSEREEELERELMKPDL